MEAGVVGRRATPRAGILGGALLLAMASGLVYQRTLAALADTWSTNDTYSHGPLVPIVSLALAWSARARLAAAPLAPDARGVALVALACALQLVGLRADVLALQGWSIPVLLFGLSLAFLGPARTRVLAFPIGFLGFMLTFPPIVVNQLSFALKEVAVRISTAIAEALGVLFRRDGMTLYLANGELRIEHPCSGLRSLLALCATGTLFAKFLPGSPLRRLALAASAVPIAIVANALRLAFLIVVAHYAGIRQATGPLHDASGYAIYVVALLALLALRALLLPRRAARGAGRGAAP